MKRIALLAAVAVLTPVGAAAAEDPEILRWKSAQKTPITRAVVDTTEIRRVQFRPVKPLPPLVLPDIKGRVWKLKQADREWLAPQLKKSKQVVAFFGNPEHRWVTAPRQQKCWDVPWERQCTVARAKLRLHHGLAEVAQFRLWHELPTPNDWSASLRVIQRVFPGTYDWGMSCSGAEGSHGKFVLYQSKPYYPGAEYAKTFHGWMVGGWMQYMWPTFKGHYRNGLAALRKAGFDVKLPAVDDVRAWQMPMAQAIAATWARWSGNDNSHWSASFGNGC